MGCRPTRKPISCLPEELKNMIKKSFNGFIEAFSSTQNQSVRVKITKIGSRNTYSYRDLGARPHPSHRMNRPTIQRLEGHLVQPVE